MGKLPKDIKLSPHAKQRLYERKPEDIKYNVSNIMKSSIKWYGKDDLIYNSALYKHCCWTTRQSNQIGYITDGNIEVIYGKTNHVAITILEVKDQFKPITQYIKPSKLLKSKKEKIKKMDTISKPRCKDCGYEVTLNRNGVCKRCARRQANMKARGKEYIPYLELSKEEQQVIDMRRASQSKSKRKQSDTAEPEPELTVPDNNSYYISKANQAEVTTRPMMKPIKPIVLGNEFDPLSDLNSFVKIVKECGCEISDTNLKDALNILTSVDKLKDVFMALTKKDSQYTITKLDKILDTTETKLRYNWEYNGFQETDDLKFKGFLMWRRVLKDSIIFLNKLYQTNAITEIQRACNLQNNVQPTSVQKENGVITPTLTVSINKRWKITTESVSTIYNTRQPFTRVFYAPDADTAHKMLVAWMADRNLHENKSKTTVVELKMEG